MYNPTIVTRTTAGGLTVFELRYDVFEEGPRYAVGPFRFGPPWIGFDDSSAALLNPLKFESEAQALAWLSEGAEEHAEETLDEVGHCGDGRSAPLERKEGQGLRSICGPDGRDPLSN